MYSHNVSVNTLQPQSQSHPKEAAMFNVGESKILTASEGRKVEAASSMKQTSPLERCSSGEDNCIYYTSVKEL